MSEPSAPPPELRARVSRDLGPTAPLASPWRRALWLAVVAAMLLWWVPFHFGVRHDLAALGPQLSLVASLFQLVGGVLVLAGALLEAVPGRQLGERRVLLLGALGLGAFLAITLASAQASATTVPPGRELRYLQVCLGTPPLLGLPLLVLAVLLAFRAFPVRPVLVGALAGLGSGLVVDSSWRLFCEVADPAHVLTAHGGAVLALGVLGAVLGQLGAWWQARL